MAQTAVGVGTRGADREASGGRTSEALSRPSFRVADQADRALDLYPGLLKALRIAFRNSRERERLSGWRTDEGRRSGARC
jgi:hypothetical protein